MMGRCLFCRSCLGRSWTAGLWFGLDGFEWAEIGLMRFELDGLVG